MPNLGSLMDYDEYWQKWLSRFIEDFVRNNVINSKKQGVEFISVDDNHGYVSQAITSFSRYS
jgi:hypothetical protein